MGRIPVRRTGYSSRKRRRVSRRLGYVPLTHTVYQTNGVLVGNGLTGHEIRPGGDIPRYKWTRMFLAMMMSMPSGHIMNFIVVKSNYPVSDFNNLVTAPGLMVKEAAQDAVSVCCHGCLSSVGVSGQEVVKFYSKGISFGYDGVTQTQHVYVIMYASAEMKRKTDAKLWLNI